MSCEGEFELQSSCLPEPRLLTKSCILGRGGSLELHQQQLLGLSVEAASQNEVQPRRATTSTQSPGWEGVGWILEV